jgi:plastocyanin
MDAAALFIAIISALGTGAAAIIAWTARADSIRATKEAAQSAERATQAVEKMASIQSALFDGPPWTLTWFNGDTFLLTNNSTIDAHNVTVETDPENLRLIIQEDQPWLIGAKSAVKFMFSASLGDGMKRDLLVSWQRGENEEAFHWRHPIPTRPDR